MSRPSLNVFAADRIPPQTLRSIDFYVRERIPPGDFLYAVLTNDLKGAISFADNENLEALPAIVAYVRNHTPADCQGSPVKVQQWLEDR